MLDFRSFLYTSTEQLACLAWLVFALLGTLMGLRHASYRTLAAALLVVVALNLALHLDYQFRGSLYIYAAHLHFPVFALGMGAAPWVSVQRLPVRAAYVAVLLALAAMAMLVNTQRASAFVVTFDTLAYPPDAVSIRP